MKSAEKPQNAPLSPNGGSMGYEGNPKCQRYPWPDRERYHGFSPPAGGSDGTGVRYVYFLQQGDLVKVGMAKDVRQRFEAFRLGSPRGLHLRGHREVPAALVHQTEKKIHRALVEHAVGREWFRTTPARAREVAKPIIAAAFKAHAQFAADGFWTREYEAPPAPPEAMTCGLPRPPITLGAILSEEWLEMLRAWSPELPQAAAFVAIDLPMLLRQMHSVVRVGDDSGDHSEAVRLVEITTDGWYSAVELLETALTVPAIKHMLVRWERRGGKYVFEAPSRWVFLQVRAAAPAPRVDIGDLVKARAAAKRKARKPKPRPRTATKAAPAPAPVAQAVAPVPRSHPDAKPAPPKASAALRQYMVSRGLWAS